MAIKINTMDVPESCMQCPFKDNNLNCLVLNENLFNCTENPVISYTWKNEKCPIEKG